LEAASMVIVPTSTVAIEALAFGCRVLVPVFTDFFTMSPLVAYERFYEKIYQPADLKRALDEFQGQDTGGRNGDDERSFVRNFWNLDPSLANWKVLLGIKE